MLGYDPLETDIVDTKIRMEHMSKYIKKLREEMKGLNPIQLGEYKREHASSGWFDTFCYLHDPERQARVLAAQLELEEHFPGMRHSRDFL